jgi:hypothetical protein
MYAQFQFFYFSVALFTLLLLKPGNISRRRLVYVIVLLLVLSGLSSYHSILLGMSLLAAFAVVRWTPLVRKRLNRETPHRIIMILSLIGGAVVAVFSSGALNLLGFAVIRLVGVTTGQFFTLIPDNSTLTYHSVFDGFLFRLHPYAILLAIPGVFLLIRRDWRISAILTAMFGVPYLTYSTLFASYTTTTIYLRYILPELPLIFLFSAVTIAWTAGTLGQLANRIPTALGHLRVSSVFRVAIPLGLASLVILAPQSGFLPSLQTLSALPEPQPSYKMAANYAKAQMKDGDVVGAIWPENTYYYLGHTEYWIMSKQLSITLSGVQDGPNVKFYLTGSVLIRNSTEMYQAMLLHKRGWLFLSASDFLGISPELWSFIKSNMTFQSAASDPTLQTYFWDTGL